MFLRSRRGKPGDTYFGNIDQRWWRWDETGRVWVTDADEGGPTVIVTGGRRALEEAKTSEGTAIEGDGTI